MKAYTIYQLQDGGYYVEEFAFAGPSRFVPPLFASAKIGDCLEYIRGKFEEAKRP